MCVCVLGGGGGGAFLRVGVGWGLHLSCHFSLCSREKCCSTFYMRKSCPVKIRCLHVQLGMGVNGLKMA